MRCVQHTSRGKGAVECHLGAGSTHVFTASAFRVKRGFSGCVYVSVVGGFVAWQVQLQFNHVKVRNQTLRAAAAFSVCQDVFE